MVVPESVPPTTAAGGEKLPAWYPEWARRFDALYRSRTAGMFVLHGNVLDPVPLRPAAGQAGGADPANGAGQANAPANPASQTAAAGPAYGGLVEFCATRLFARWDVVLHYDVGRGVRLQAGSDRERLQKMIAAVSAWGVPPPFPREPDAMLHWLDQGLERSLLLDGGKGPTSIAVVIGHAEYLLPDGDPTALAANIAARLVRFLSWARNPYFRDRNVAFCLLTEKRGDLNDRLTNSPHLADIELPLPSEAERRSFLASLASDDELRKLGEYSADELVKASNGLDLTNLEQLVGAAKFAGERLVPERFRALKKSLIERRCEGLLEFVEPKRTLDLVVGSTAAVERLRRDAKLVASGNLDAAPMGYLICGPVGTGKTFLAECCAGSIGIPCVTLKNFRSKYVGETEGNLERVLSVLRSLGPVVVIIDEADAALGTRQADGDSGTSSRVFSMIAAQMGDTKYRGRILWMLLTSRPDRLPIDLKRQGRAEVHIPLFYPQTAAEFAAMFRVLGKRFGVEFPPETWDEILTAGRLVERRLSGADVESILLAARRNALSAGEAIEPRHLTEVLENFIPSAQGLEKEGQELAAVLECTQLDFLPPEYRARVQEPDGRTRLQERLTEIRRILDRRG